MIGPRRLDLGQYSAFAIGAEELAISVYEFDACDDVEAMEKATPLFHDGLKRIEVWCGSRKVGNVPRKSNEISDRGFRRSF
jgi:hypothetical protein